jgi:hypothetical protein
MHGPARDRLTPQHAVARAHPHTRTCTRTHTHTHALARAHAREHARARTHPLVLRATGMSVGAALGCAASRTHRSCGRCSQGTLSTHMEYSARTVHAYGVHSALRTRRRAGGRSLRRHAARPMGRQVHSGRPGTGRTRTCTPKLQCTQAHDPTHPYPTAHARTRTHGPGRSDSAGSSCRACPSQQAAAAVAEPHRVSACVRHSVRCGYSSALVYRPLYRTIATAIPSCGEVRCGAWIERSFAESAPPSSASSFIYLRRASRKRSGWAAAVLP